MIYSGVERGHYGYSRRAPINLSTPLLKYTTKVHIPLPLTKTGLSNNNHVVGRTHAAYFTICEKTYVPTYIEYNTTSLYRV